MKIPMTRKFNFLAALSLMFIGTAAYAQPSATFSDYSTMQEASQSASKYPERPKDMWELGVNFGHSMVSGDVYPSLPAGFGVGLHVRKALNYTMSLRAGYTFHQTSGVNHFRQGFATPAERIVLQPQGKTDYVHAFRTAMNDFSLELVANLNNMKFHKSDSKWGFYATAGLGIITHDTKLDLLDANGNAYDFSSINGLDRGQNLPDVKNILDGEYETDAYYPTDLKSSTAEPYASIGLGASYKVNKQINISIENKTILSSSEFIDGRVGDYNSLINDMINYTNFRLNFNLGNPKKQREPLYWLNPLDAPYDMIANNTQRLDNLGDILADSDGDGVPDKLDKEQNSPAGAIVNTKGETLDSDADGVADYLDKEPFSKPGVSVDANGVSTEVQPDYVTKEDVMKMESERDWVNKPIEPAVKSWFLPMIHFDNGSSKIKASYYPQLDHVATVLKSNEKINVVIEGHASATASDNFNLKLSYSRAKAAADFLIENYGISPSRLTVKYSGEAAPLEGSQATNYMNRRVEFRVNDGSETSMSAPQ